MTYDWLHVMIREFHRDTDAPAWADLTQVNLIEFRASMLDPEFDATGMYVAEVDGRIVGTADAHISPSHHEFCVLRDFKVKQEYWGAIAPQLLDAALNIFVERNARTAQAQASEENQRYVSLLGSRGFQLRSADCKMTHNLKSVPRIEDPALQLRTYAEVSSPALIAKLQNEIFEGLIGRPVTKDEIVFWMGNLEFECYVGYLDDKPVASSFCEIKEADGKRHGWIYGLGVLPDYRRQKIGTVLLYNVLNYIKRKAATCAHAETDYDSYRQRFYESAGFYIESKILNLEKTLRK